MSIPRFIAALVTIVPMLLPATAGAEIFTLDEELKPFKMTLREYPDANGARWTAASGVSGEGVDHLYVGDLSPLRAMEAYVISLSLENDVSMTLARAHWDESLNTCTTDESGMCGVKFSTQGEVGFKISAPQGTPWKLVLLTSPEVSPDSLLPSPLFEARRADAARYEAGGTPASPVDEMPAGTGAGEASGWLLPAVVVLLAVIGLLLVLLLRKRGSATTLALLAVALMTLPPEQARGISEATQGTLAALNDPLDDTQQRIAEDRAVRDRVDGNLATLEKRMQVIMALKSLAEEWHPLTPCSTVANPPGAPRIPTFCEGNEDCMACYQAARKDFNETRGTFEQLRVIYQCAMDDINSALAFGDTASGVHGVVGLTWKAERTKIEASVKNLRGAYDSKYNELGRQLQRSMIDIGVCEAKYGEPDWYDRFGFMYYEFLTDKYRRTD